MKSSLPQQPYLSLSEALAWIAFADTTNADSHWVDFHQAKAAMEAAVEAITTSASAGKISTLGKFVSGPSVDVSQLNTESIPRERFHDFRKYDPTCCGLRAGHGLLGFPDERGGAFVYTVPNVERQDYYREVLVDRDALMQEFPATMVGIKATPEQVEQWCRDWISNGKGTDGNKAWRVFARCPEFKRCSREDWFRPAWERAKKQ